MIGQYFSLWNFLFCFVTESGNGIASNIELILPWDPGTNMEPVPSKLNMDMGINKYGIEEIQTQKMRDRKDRREKR